MLPPSFNSPTPCFINSVIHTDITSDLLAGTVFYPPRIDLPQPGRFGFCGQSRPRHSQAEARSHLSAQLIGVIASDLQPS